MGAAFTPKLDLTPRDLAVLERIVRRRGVPIEILAEEFFAENPYTGELNTNPVRACEQRLRALAKAGFVLFALRSDGHHRRQLVLPGNASNGVRFASGSGCRRASRRRPPPRTSAHHIRTQDAVWRLEKYVRGKGWHVVGVQLEADLRATAQRGQRHLRPDPARSFPDAVCNVRFEDGQVAEIAVEYVTSKYTDKDILKKCSNFGRFHSVIWVADKKSTAERISALTGAACTTV